MRCRKCGTISHGVQPFCQACGASDERFLGRVIVYATVGGLGLLLFGGVLLSRLENVAGQVAAAHPWTITHLTVDGLIATARQEIQAVSADEEKQLADLHAISIRLRGGGAATAAPGPPLRLTLPHIPLDPREWSIAQLGSDMAAAPDSVGADLIATPHRAADVATLLPTLPADLLAPRLKTWLGAASAVPAPIAFTVGPHGPDAAVLYGANRDDSGHIYILRNHSRPDMPLAHADGEVHATRIGG